MNDAEQRKAARKFVQDWTGRGDEKQDTQRFWIQLLREVMPYWRDVRKKLNDSTLDYLPEEQ